MPPAVEITYREAGRDMLWTEYIDETDLDAKLTEARSNDELERAGAISKAIAKGEAVKWKRAAAAVGVSGVSVVASLDVFVPPMGAAFHALPTLGLKDPPDVGTLTVSGFTSSWDRDGKERHALKDSTGKVWRIKSAARENQLVEAGLTAGMKLDVKLWAVQAPRAAAGGAGGSNDPI